MQLVPVDVEQYLGGDNENYTKNDHMYIKQTTAYPKARSFIDER